MAFNATREFCDNPAVVIMSVFGKQCVDDATVVLGQQSKRCMQKLLLLLFFKVAFYKNLILHNCIN